MSSIPQSWAPTTLAGITSVIRGRVKPEEKAHLPFIGMDNVEAHTTRLLGTIPAASMNSAAIHFQPHDVLYGRLRPYLNKVVCAEHEGLASAEFIPLTPAQGVLPKFLLYRVNASDFVSYASHLDEGDRPRVGYDQIGEFALVLPPTGAQHRIVEAIESYFTRLDDAAATLERVQRNLKRYRASVLKAAVEGRLVPTEAELSRAEGRDYEPASVLLERILAERRRRWEENELAKMNGAGKTPRDNAWTTKYQEPVHPDDRQLSALPDGWVWSTLDQLTLLIDGGNAATATSQPTNRRVLRSSAVRQGSIDFTDYRFLPNDASASEDAFLCEGDLLFTRLSGTLDYVGNCAVVPPLAGERFEFPDRIFRARANVLVFGPYVALCFGARHLRVRLEAAAKSSAGHQRISLSDLREFHIPLPPFTEQLRIVAEVEHLLSVAATTTNSATLSLHRCQRLRQSILKWAFEGRLVDQDPTDEPASALLERIKAERAASAETSKSNRNPRRKGNSANA